MKTLKNKVKCIVSAIVALFGFPVAFIILLILDVLLAGVKKMINETQHQWNRNWKNYKLTFKVYIRSLKEQWKGENEQ